MKILVCSMNEDDTKFVGFKREEVVIVSEPRLVKIPGAPSGVVGGILERGKLYIAVPIPGFGDYPIRMFVLVKQGYAVGVTRVIGFVDSEEVYDIAGEDLRIFEKAVEYDENMVYVLNLEAFEIPEQEFEVPSPPPEIEERVSDLGESFLIAHMDEESIAIRMNEVRGIVEWSEVNEFRFGRIRGFVSHAGDIVTVVSFRDVPKPKWCVVLKDHGIPIISGEVTVGEIVEGSEKSFVIFQNEKIELVSEDDLREMVKHGLE